MTESPQVAISRARDEFLRLVADVRPELHRYCARLTGSVIDGEDIVQETLARAFYALSMSPEMPALRPWLFRIAHNAALDFLKRNDHKLTDPRADMAEVVGASEELDPYVARVALARFATLPVVQRSAVILKDVLGHSLEEVAATMETTIMAVKAALVRGRANLREVDAKEQALGDAQREQLDRYASLFNARDWDGVRALIGEDCRLDLVSRSQRRGKEVGTYFERYANEDVRLRAVLLDGDLVLAAYVNGGASPAYFIVLGWDEGRVQTIRDFRYVPYIASEAAISEQ